MTLQTSTEREAKLTAAAELVVPDLHELFRDLEVEAPTVQRLDACYFDTVDLRLARAGVTLRRRSGNWSPPWTLKLPEDTNGATLARREIVEDGDDTSVPESLLDLVRGYVRREPVVAVARVRTARTATKVADRHHQTLVELVDDTVTVDIEPDVTGGGHRRAQSSFREIEIEIKVDRPRSRQLVRGAIERLVTCGFEIGPPLPKVIRGLGPAARKPPDGVAPQASGANITTTELIATALARAVSQLIRSDPAVRLGESAEAVHQFRTAIRRLRSDLRTFRSVIDPQWMATMRGELAWLAGPVSAVRDGDVLMGRLQRQIATLPGLDQQAAGPLLHLLEQHSRAARQVLLAAMRSARYDQLLDTLVSAVHSPASVSSGQSGSIPAEHLHVVGRPWRQLATRAGRLGTDPSDDALHQVRILAKRCRYAAEAVAPVVGRPARQFARAMVEVQTLLGDHQDAVVTEAWLRAAVGDLASTCDTVSDTDSRFMLSEAARTATTLSAGELLLLQRTDRAMIRSRWPVVWNRASARKLRSWI